MARTVLDLDSYVPALITFVSNKLSSGASSTYRKLFGIGVTEWRIIALLALEPNISANRICQVIGFDKALVSRSVRLLAQRGYLRIGPDEADARRKVIALTDKGDAVHDQIVQVALEREKRLMADFTPEERDSLVSLLRRMHARIPIVNAYEPEPPRLRRKRAGLREAAE